MVFGRWAHRLSPALEVLASHRLPVERPHNSFVVLDGGELVTKDCDAPPGLRPLHALRARSRDASARGAAARAAGAQHRPPRLRRRERDRGRDGDGAPPAARPRCRADRDRRALAAPLRPGARSQLRLGPGDHRPPRLLDGQRPQPHRPHDAGQRRGVRPGEAVVGAARGFLGGPLGGDQRAALRDRVEPPRLGPGRARSLSPTTPATPYCAPGVSPGTSWSRSGAATHSPMPAT